MLENVYCLDVPELIRKLARTEEMIRLKDVGMDCGCEYTSFPLFAGKTAYHRYEHSLGVALIVWNFTRDIRMTTAGLFHDIASPVFAHVVDFLNHDYMVQESTEQETEKIIRSSPSICTLLKEHGIQADEVSDYHLYPIADNDSPQLSADRLEYTLTNFVRYLGYEMDLVARMYQDLSVAENEYGQPELSFSSQQLAEEFALGALRTGRIYTADEDRYSMELLARLLRKAIDAGIISHEDLHTTEKEVISKINGDAVFANLWQQFRDTDCVYRSDVRHSPDWIRIQAKKRYIDPYVIGLGRVSTYSGAFAREKEAFLSESFDYYLNRHPFNG